MALTGPASCEGGAVRSHRPSHFFYSLQKTSRLHHSLPPPLCRIRHLRAYFLRGVLHIRSIQAHVVQRRHRAPELPVIRFAQHGRVLFLPEFQWFHCCTVDHHRFLAQSQQGLAMFATRFCPPQTSSPYLNLAHITFSTAKNATQLDTVPFAHPRPHLPQVRLRGREREVVAMHTGTRMRLGTVEYLGR